MKTAISVPDPVFREAEQYARRAKKSRSQVYGEAVAEYLARHVPEAITETMNDVCTQLGGQRDEFVEAAPINETPEYLREAKAFVGVRAARGISAPDESRPLFIPELNHSRRIEGVARGLQQRGHPAATIEKIIGGNFHRAFKGIWTM